MVINIILFIIIYIYVFTDIKNKLIRVSDVTIIKRTLFLLFFAMLISFVQGFYVIQLQAKPILENSGFLSNIYSAANANKFDESLANQKEQGLDKVLRSFNSKKENLYDGDLPDYANYTGKLDFKAFELNNFKRLDGFFQFFKLRYIWSILLSQFMMSILIGIVLQLLWEDRPITEPL
jgi:hypothetical protein